MHKRVQFGLPLVATLLIASSAAAGPVEILDGVSIAPDDPKTIVLRYRNGQGGLFVSHDGGESFAFLCNTGIDPSFMHEPSAAAIRTNGAILFGVFDGLWQGDKDACGFAKQNVFDGQWVNDFAFDPTDNARLYAITSAGGKDNGIYLNDGTSKAKDDWQPVGTQEKVLIGRLQVADLGSGKLRFYESIADGTYDTGTDNEQPRYYIRYSDDQGKTWTKQDFGKTDAALRLVAVDPTDPQRIVVALLREQIGPDGLVSLPDELQYSDKAGAKGSFEKIGEVTELAGVTFAPDGRLFYGDREQTTPALYSVAKLGDAPKKLSGDYKVQCVRYDAQTDELYVCKDRAFGTADPETGAFTEIFDTTKAEAFVSCAGEASPAADRCQVQLLAAWCGITHFPATPFCAGYDVPGYDAGVSGSSDAGTSGAGAAGKGSGSDAADGGKSDGSCSVSALGHTRGPARERGPWASLMGLVVIVALGRWHTLRRAARVRAASGA